MSKLKSIFDAKPDTFEYTKGQREALEKVEKFLNTPGEHFFMLAGFSGCGN